MSPAAAPLVQLSVAEGVAVIRVDHPPVNALSQPVRQGLLDALAAAAADAAVSGIIIICQGRTFIVGGDIKEFEQPLQAPHLWQVIASLEALSKPVLAAMHGSALGGGFEIALACDFRFANAQTNIGLPEIKLGILPGCGGTQRLPRLIGVEAALKMILSGDPVDANEALRLGAIDHISSDNLLQDALQFMRRAVAYGTPLRKTSRLQARCEKPEILVELEKDLTAAGADAMARLFCVKALKAAWELPFDEGLQLERRYGETLLDSEQSKILRAAFFKSRGGSRPVPGTTT